MPGAKQQLRTKKIRNSGCKNIGRQFHHGDFNANKVRIFVAGEVFLIDIDLLMGDKPLILQHKKSIQ